MSAPRTAARLAIGAALVAAGVGHLSVMRDGFRGQVPRALTERLPFDEDDVVLMSGVAEIGLGLAFAALPAERRTVGRVVAAFFVAVFPGNVSQLLRHDPAFGLDTDRKRALRLVFQPALVGLALWAGSD